MSPVNEEESESVFRAGRTCVSRPKNPGPRTAMTIIITRAFEREEYVAADFGADRRPPSRSGYCPVPFNQRSDYNVSNQKWHNGGTACQRNRPCAAQSPRHRTAWRVDNGRADTIQELYVDDGELTLPPGPMRGRDALRAWGRRIVLTVMVAGEQASTTVPFSVVEDHDWFARTEQGWRFVSRRWVELFARGDTLNLPGNKSGLRFR
jgi:hypothetical protein